MKVPNGFTVGVDDDNEELHQFVHVCWPYTEGTNVGYALIGSRESLALCGTKRLWGFNTGTDPSRVDCPICLERLGSLK